MATQTDIEIVQGATFNMSMTWTTDDDPPQPISLDGYGAHMQIRSKPGAAGAPWVNIGSQTGEITLEPGNTTGLLAIRIPSTVTATLKKNGWYDLFVFSNTDMTEAVRLLAGQVILDKSVTTSDGLVF